MAALGSQSIASSYEQLLHVDADGGGNSTTHVSVKDGDNGTTFGFTIASDALMMSSTNRLEFGDTGTYIHQSADGVLDLVSDTEIEINATTIDMNGALDVSGNAQLSGTVTVGADGSGTDVIFYSGTAGDNFTWDASAEKLTITGTDGQTALDVADGNLVVADNIDCEGDIDINGTANLDEVDIDGEVNLATDVTAYGHIKIDADDKALILGADQDASIFSNAAGEIYFARGTDLTLTTDDTEGWASFNIGSSAETSLQIWGGEGGNSTIYMYSDTGDDNADKWKISSTGSQLLIGSYSTGSWVTHMYTTTDGSVVKPKNPAFLATQSSNQDNLSVNTSHDVVFGTEVFDQGGNFASNTFTAPVTGRYQLNFQMQLENMDIDATYYKIEIVSSNRDYSFYRSISDTDVELFTFSGSVLADMDTNDTVKLTFYQVGGSAQTDIKAGTWFSGHLAC